MKQEDFDMKNTRTLWQACNVAIVAFIGFVMVACHTVTIRDSASSPSGDGFLGATLNLYGSMWTVGYDDGSVIPIWERLDEDTIVFSDFGGTGTFANGQLNFSIDSPDSSFLEPIERMFQYDEDLFTTVFYRDLSIGPLDAMFVILAILDTPYKEFSRQYFAGTEQSLVVYVYVDQDVTITASGTTLNKWGRTVITADLNLPLMAGWNALHHHEAWCDYELVRSITLGDPPHLRWVTPQ